jgi:glutathione reductase (NADPH)
VVNGAGRIANVDHLDLDAGGVKHDNFRISVDVYLRSTSNSAVHACGDVLSGPPQLSPLATYEGMIVGSNIVEGPKHKPDYASLPSAVYTVPALATLGLTEAQAKEKGLKAKVTVSDMEYWFSTRTYAETKAWAKVIVDEASDQILGAYMVGHAAEEATFSGSPRSTASPRSSSGTSSTPIRPSAPTSSTCSRPATRWGCGLGLA